MGLKIARCCRYKKLVISSMWAAAKKVIMFVHLWKIFCEEYSVFSILRGEKKSGKFSHFYLSIFLTRLLESREEGTGEFWRDSLPSGEFVQLQNQRIEPLNYLSTMRVLNTVNTQNVHTEYKRKKMIWLLLKSTS